jgi:transcription initiation factor IIE alpha subunit
MHPQIAKLKEIRSPPCAILCYACMPHLQIAKLKEKREALQKELDDLEAELKDAKKGKGGNPDT